MTWAMDIPTSSLDNPAARHVLLCMANYAGPEGRGAFPSAATISKQTGLSERTVRLKLDELAKAGWIAEGNQAIAAAYIDRRDRRPVVYDLQLKRGANAAPRKDRGADDRTGCSSQQNGVQENAERGAAAAPNTSLNHQGTKEQQPREISDVIADQDLQAIEPTDDRQRFAMFADWSPDSRYLIAQAQIAGVKPTDISDSILRSFKGWFVAKPGTVDSAAGWCNRLVIWFQKERAKGNVPAAKPEAESTGDWASKGVIL
ncbi:Helix-turn-helix domain-containing protein [Pseudomonas asturiensis]|uniref:Helix-turn-helix domain-containing protein n=1 Tax=Pseudomonas asturiensis TaxID=1190415 RepID=A0A1M7IYX9_9PSED|nr:helix-turn-helix domain-containing protein [Pseudomonas asturiensis]SHM45929.1 Helix-turn-helix domain-containing protein [Pseudomonas asturiensis]